MCMNSDHNLVRQLPPRTHLACEGNGEVHVFEETACFAYCKCGVNMQYRNNSMKYTFEVDQLSKEGGGSGALTVVSRNKRDEDTPAWQLKPPDTVSEDNNFC
jgi:hypothetical protein